MFKVFSWASEEFRGCKLRCCSSRAKLEPVMHGKANAAAWRALWCSYKHEGRYGRVEVAEDQKVQGLGTGHRADTTEGSEASAGRPL